MHPGRQSTIPTNLSAAERAASHIVAVFQRFVLLHLATGRSSRAIGEHWTMMTGRRRSTPPRRRMCTALLLTVLSSPLLAVADTPSDRKGDAERELQRTPRCAPPFRPTTAYAEGDLASTRGYNYRCRDFPASRWCGTAGYGPGRGAHWSMAWERLDQCQSASQSQGTTDVSGQGSVGNKVGVYKIDYAPSSGYNSNYNGYTSNQGAAGTSPQAAAMTVQSSNLPGCADLYQVPSPGYTAGERVSFRGVIYECKEFPATAWCDISGYAPGGPFGNLAWNRVGECTLENTAPQSGLAGDSVAPYKPQTSSQSDNGNLQPRENTCAPRYRTGARYANGDVVSSNGVNVICSISKWCPDPKFEPHEGKYWELVWDRVGPCAGAGSSGASDGVNGASVGNNGPTPNPTRRKRPTGANPAIPQDDTSDSNVLSSAKNGPCPPLWSEGHSYSEGETVNANGNVYSCKSHPYTGWCGVSSLYEPSKGQHWDMAWDVVASCDGKGMKPLTSPPTQKPTPRPSKKPVKGGSKTEGLAMANDGATSQNVYDILDAKSSAIDNDLFLYQGTTPSEVYRYEGFIAGLQVMAEEGVAGKQFYLGNDSENGYLAGLVNIAAFIGQSMKETIQYDACDENNWDLVDMTYPLSNACGQLGQSYQDYHCPDHEKHMECEVDPDMSIMGVTHAKWYGAPGPMFCGPKSEYPHVGKWDYSYHCNNPWAEPPEYCTDYEGQKAGKYDNSEEVANRNGRTDVEGCCWWGRGVIQTTGICNFGKLNYFLGAKAKKDGRPARYPQVDFCKDPEVICSSEEHKELKWIAGMFYWIESLQSYDDGWNYMEALQEFVDSGMTDHSFIDKVSGIVNRGCHDPPCGTGPVDGASERAGNFQKVLSVLTS